MSDFEASIAAAERLSRIEKRYKDPPHSETAPTVEALRGGFCVLVVGSFERFLSEAFTEHLASLVGTHPPLSYPDLPDKLRLTSVFESLQFAMTGPRHGRPKGRGARFPEVVAAARRVVAENIDPAALGQTKGNPDSETVTSMFGGLGIKTPFDQVRQAFDARWNKPEAATFLSDKLDEIVNARHVVAHTASALMISRVDLADWPAFLRTLAAVLDERLDLYVSNVLVRKSPP
ncbi:MAG: HEPN domain-containing protein [Actinomycetota bacterium]|nr:HEPN domain-containing protein [Actinomycetota bacterium]